MELVENEGMNGHRGRKKFSPRERDKVKSLIRDLHRDKPNLLKYDEIAEHLNVSGIVHVNAKIWGAREVSNFLNRNPVRLSKSKWTPVQQELLSQATPPEIKSGDEKVLKDIRAIIAINTDAESTLKMIRGLLRNE